MADQNLDYTFCDTTLSMKSALAALRASSILAFDCEGQDLGAPGGSLSLISLRTIQATSPQTFIFDVIRLNKKGRRPLYDILESEHIQKVMFDGRKDHSCLYHDRHIQLRNVIDLQLADVKSRVLRGEGEAEQLHRLRGALLPKELYKNRHMYKKIHKLLGLKGCATEHLGFIQTRGPRFDHSLWMERPLPAEYLHHAVEDVLLIQQLYDFFSAAGYLYSRIIDDSSHYVSIWNDRRPAKDDIYRNHGFLHLYVLDRVEGGAMRECLYCERMLPEGCFFKPKGKATVASRQCFVCRAAELRPDWKKLREGVNRR